MKTVLRIGCGLAVLVLAACGSDAKPKKPITIGAVYDDTGSSKNYFWEQNRAMAVDQMNQALDKAKNGKDLKFVLESRGHQADKKVDGVPYVYQLVRELRDLGARALFADTSAATNEAAGSNYDPTDPLGLVVTCTPCTSSNLNNPNAPTTTSTGAAVDPILLAGQTDVDNWLWRTSITYDNQVYYLMQTVLDRPATHDGDYNGDGYVKIAVYTARGATPTTDLMAGGNGSAIKRGVTAHLPAGVTAHYQAVGGPTDGGTSPDDPATYAGYDSDLAALVDNSDGHDVDFIAINIGPTFVSGIMRAYNQANLTTKPPIAHASSSMRANIVQELLDGYNGQEGIANEVFRDDDSGHKYAADFTAYTGAPPAGYDSSVYDAMVTMMLGVLKAGLPLADPTTVTPAQVHEAMSQINAPSGTVVRTGVDEFAKAVDLIVAGTDINYEGASGPVDFDDVGDVRGNVGFWKVEDQKFVTEHLWDCINSGTKLLVGCTQVQ